MLVPWPSGASDFFMSNEPSSCTTNIKSSSSFQSYLSNICSGISRNNSPSSSLMTVSVLLCILFTQHKFKSRMVCSVCPVLGVSFPLGEHAKRDATLRWWCGYINQSIFKFIICHTNIIIAVTRVFNSHFFHQQSLARSQYLRSYQYNIL